MIVADLAPLATPLEDVRLLEGNPRRGDLDAIARSLEAFGQRKPIVANRATGEVIAGNHTVQAARQLGWTEVAVVWVDDDPTTAHAYALADNRTAELGGYDDAALAALLAEVQEEGDEALWAATGWTDDDLERLLDELEEPKPPPPVAPRSWAEASGAGVMRGDALALPLRSGSVDLVVSSPPYFALRSYQDDGDHYAGQLGSEPTPAEFLAALWAVMDECWRALDDNGSAWINLGDKYAGGNGQSGGTPQLEGGASNGRPRGDLGPKTGGYVPTADVPDKSLMGLPWRFALGLICPDQYRPGGGPTWTLRAEVIWDKPNGLPESVTDRVRRSHEQWFHLVKGPRYFAAVDEVREEQAGGVVNAPGPKRNVGGGSALESGAFSSEGGFNDRRKVNGIAYNPLGKLPGSVWSIPSQPLTVPDDLGVDHFAAFPAAWPRRIIDGWSPTGICTACGEGRVPAVDREKVGVSIRGEATTQLRGGTIDGGGYAQAGAETWQRTEATITGYRCACPAPDAPTRPAVILDPFGGTGTVAMMARAMGRYGVHVDLSRDYNRLACWRIFESGGGERCLARAED